MFELASRCQLLPWPDRRTQIPLTPAQRDCHPLLPGVSCESAESVPLAAQSVYRAVCWKRDSLRLLRHGVS
jgi:hypothetical protein